MDTAEPELIDGLFEYRSPGRKIAADVKRSHVGFTERGGGVPKENALSALPRIIHVLDFAAYNRGRAASPPAGRRLLGEPQHVSRPTCSKITPTCVASAAK